MSRKTDFKVPYKNGKLQHYARANSFADPEYGNQGEEWRDNKPFRATMVIAGMNTGPYAKSVLWMDGDGYFYPMFLIDLVDTLKIANVVNREITADWIVCRRGSNYGIRIYEGE